ncbi:MAG TPA: tetratricopeptide repeat protein, partial [Anaerolineales bacterium]|nr:tetratricopeptide repeat protein [Anaerolineales bacterium]
MILYRSVGLQELALIYDSGMKAFPARLPQQPIFYPVLDLEYARQTASGWNAQNGQFAGYVTQFKVEDEYIQKFEKHTVGESQHEEFWIPAEEVEEFNQHINGQIKVVDAHFGGGFQGFIPEQFGLQGKNAVEQFTVLSNSYIYKRMEFFLEIKRNHKAVFLNYPFWQKYDSKNPGLKEKILQAIKEAWFTSFPKNPLMSPIQDDTRAEKQLDSEAAVNPVVEDRAPVQQRNSPAQVQPVKQPITPPKKTPFSSFIRPVQPASVPVEPRKPQRIVKSAPEDITPVNQRESHFVQGIKLGLSGKYHDAIDELSKTIREAPDQVVAHTSLGVAYHRLGEDDRALACYQTALKIDPNYAEAHYFRANILYGRGDVREAIAAYTRAIGLDPDLIEAHQNPMPQDRLTDYT